MAGIFRYRPYTDHDYDEKGELVRFCECPECDALQQKYVADRVKRQRVAKEREHGGLAPYDKGKPTEGGANHDQEQRPRDDRPTYGRYLNGQNKRKLFPIVGPEEAPEELEDKPSLKDVLAKSHFDEPRWWLENVLAWIAIRRVEAVTLSYEDIRRLRHNAIMLKGSEDVLVSKNPNADLLELLRKGDIKAIGPDHTDLRPEFWDNVVSHDLRTWPAAVRFRREDVLRAFPAAGAQPAAPLSDEELDTVICSLAKENGVIPSQNKCAEIVRENHPQITRKKVRERFKTLFPDMSQGKGARKYCAE